MSKYSFLIYHKDRNPFMVKLMDMGVMHIIEKDVQDDNSSKKQREEIALAEQVLKSLLQRNKSGHHNLPRNPDYVRPTVANMPLLEKKLEERKRDRAALLIQIKLLEPWGDFSLEHIKKLEKETDIVMRFCRHPKRKFQQEWHNDHVIEIINQENGFLYFIIFQTDGSNRLPVVPLALPKRSLSELKQSLIDCEKEILTLDQELDYYAITYTDLLRESIEKSKEELDLHRANLSVEFLQNEKIIHLEGWCPELEEKKLQAFLNKEHIVFSRLDTSKEDNPPVLLKNNRFAKLFEPIGRLFSLPAYSELDLTVFFAPFFFLFFGFCLGDVGYGITFILVGSLLKLKIKGPNRDYLTLIQLFGISTVVIGFLSGTLFGTPMSELPFFAANQNIFLNQIELLQLALAVGFIQIVFGMGLQVYKQVVFRGWKFGLSKTGWIILCLSLLDLFAIQWVPQISTITAWIGVAFIVFFGSPESGWLKSFGFGLLDLYNITGVMGDLLSYIRLFALGVSSAILGLVVNNMAVSAKGIPYVGVVLFVIVLVVGHTANLLLASLSAFVHPMRLTFVEFYKNTGFIGGGKPYKPLARKVSKK